jgi:predicted NAD/FAD-dependent oxidoreductase
MSESTQVIVIGAGIAGLQCARELTRRGIRTTVLERSRGVGGRCATRRILDGQPVDHGVPFVHGTSAAFFAALDALESDGRLESWPKRIRGPRLACQPDAFRPGRFRAAHERGVNQFPKMLAQGLDVRLEKKVEGLAESGSEIALSTSGGDELHAPVVVVATHPPVAWPLMSECCEGWPGTFDDEWAVQNVEVVPALCVLAAYPMDSPEPPFDIWYPVESPLLHTISHDSAKRSGPGHRVLVLQARPGFSREWLEAPPEEWVAELLREAADLLGTWAGTPEWHVGHRWRAARVRPEDTHGRAPWFESPRGARIGVIGDAWSHRGGVEGAFESGDAMAERIAGLPDLERMA